MSATTFDTLSFSKKLQGHGFPLNQAEGLAEVASAVIDDIHIKFGAIDKKFDAIDKRFDSLEHRMNSLEKKFDLFESKFDYKLEAKTSRLESNLIKCMIGMSTGLFSAMIGIAIFTYRLIT